MQSALEQETDEEYFDDPIKLFDSEQERVHFGSQSFDVTTSPTNNTLCPTSDPNDVENDGDTSNCLNEFNRPNCMPLSVKLVDCGKFPWYFRRHTLQILEKTNVCDLTTDSDTEADEKQVSDDNSDCLILENMNDEVNKTTKLVVKCDESKSPPIVVNKTPAEKREETLKRKENVQILEALSKKNKSLVDYKRNIGLIGLTVSQKFVKDPIACKKIQHNYTKSNKDHKSLDIESYVSAMHKKLDEIGTALIPIPEDREKPVNIKEVNEKLKSEETKISVQLSFDKISEKLVRRVKIKNFSANDQTDKTKSDILNKTKRKPNSDTNLNTKLALPGSSNKNNGSKHVKNVMKTNIYRNTHVKALKNTIFDLIKSSDKNITNEENIKKIEDRTDQSLCKSNDQREPNSPILTCTSLPKKLAQNILTKKNDNVSQVITQSTIKDNLNSSDKGKPTELVNENISSGNQQYITKDNGEQEQRIVIIKPNIVNEINANSEGALGQKNNNCTVPKVAVPSTTSFSPTSFLNGTVQTSLSDSQDHGKSITITTNNDSIAVSQALTKEAVPKTITAFPVGQNIPRPINVKQKHFPNMQYFNHIVQNSPRMPEQYKSRSFQNPMNYHSPAPRFDRRFIPRSANCADPNCRYPLPNEYVHQHQYNLPQFQSFLNNSFYKHYPPPPRCHVVSETDNMHAKRYFHPGNLNQSKKYLALSFQQTNRSQTGPVPANLLNMNNMIPPQMGNQGIIKIKANNIIPPGPGNTDLYTNQSKNMKTSENFMCNLKRAHSQQLQPCVEQPPMKRSKTPQTLDQDCTQNREPKGYSAPILPIPTFEKVLNKVKTDVLSKHKADRTKTGTDMKDEKKNIEKHRGEVRRNDTKRISVSDYMNRLSRGTAADKSPNKKISKHNNNDGMNVQNKGRDDVNRSNAETDLGYDSDSTVKL